MPGTETNRLTRKQEYFCNLIANDHTISHVDAAIKAGYRKENARITAAKNLTKTNIIAKIDEIKEEKKKLLDVDENWVLKKLKNFANAQIMDYFELRLDEQGKPIGIQLKDLTKLSEEKLAAIESIKETKAGIEIKLIDKRACVVDIGKHFGMFKDIIEGNLNQTTTQKIFVIPAFNMDNVSSN